METITDKKGFSCNVVEKSRYNALSQEQKVYFEMFRNSILEIFPVGNKNIYDDSTIAFAERFAFIGIQITDKLSKDIETKIKEMLATMVVPSTDSSQTT